MDHFHYTKGALHAEEVPVSAIAEAVGTPCYIYSSATLERHYRVFSEAFSSIDAQICFALKCNSNLAVIKTLADMGAGADTVSEGEIRRALAAGVPAEKIVFSGVGKSPEEMRYGLEQQIGQFNVESIEELELLSEVAVAAGKKARIAIRVNPDVDAITHGHITTGRKIDKFGIPWETVMDTYAKAAKLPNIEIIGVTTHIGSQLTQLNPFKQAFQRVKELVTELRAAGHSIRTIDLGGGLGIPYGNGSEPPHPADYAELIINTIRDINAKLILEPGRLIAGNAGILVSKVLFTKRTPHRSFLIVDAGMNDLMRPALYNAFHEIIPVQQHDADAPLERVDVVGPVCESTDVFARERDLPLLENGDLLAFRSAGAYGAVMAGTYNSRLLVPEVMVKGSEFAVIRPRPSYEALLAEDKLPGWL